jgi:hypothetical protein
MAACGRGFTYHPPEVCSLTSSGSSIRRSRARCSAENPLDTPVVRAVAGGHDGNRGGGAGAENGCFLNQGVYPVYALEAYSPAEAYKDTQCRSPNPRSCFGFADRWWRRRHMRQGCDAPERT